MIPYQRIADSLRGQITAGKLVPGDRVDSIHVLCDRYGVSQGTITAALRVLRDEGLIETQQGRGTFVLMTPGEPEPSPEFQILAARLSELAARVETLEEALEAKGKRGPRASA